MVAIHKKPNPKVEKHEKDMVFAINKLMSDFNRLDLGEKNKAIIHLLNYTDEIKVNHGNLRKLDSKTVMFYRALYSIKNKADFKTRPERWAAAAVHIYLASTMDFSKKTRILHKKLDKLILQRVKIYKNIGMSNSIQ